jgi:antitoxin ParD1/3/4
MATMNISLPDKMRDWVESQIEAGQYSNNSDYVRDLIRKDEQRNDKLIALQNAVTVGLKSGEPTVFNKDAFKSRMIENKKDG